MLTMYAHLRGVPDNKIDDVVSSTIDQLSLEKWADKLCGNYRFLIPMSYITNLEDRTSYISKRKKCIHKAFISSNLRLTLSSSFFNITFRKQIFGTASFELRRESFITKYFSSNSIKREMIINLHKFVLVNAGGENHRSKSLLEYQVIIKKYSALSTIFVSFSLCLSIS